MVTVVTVVTGVVPLVGVSSRLEIADEGAGDAAPIPEGVLVAGFSLLGAPDSLEGLSFIRCLGSTMLSEEVETYEDLSSGA